MNLYYANKQQSNTKYNEEMSKSNNCTDSVIRIQNINIYYVSHHAHIGVAGYSG